MFSLANAWLSARGAKHRKRCGGCVQQPTEHGAPGGGSVIMVGTFMDAIPEAAVLGLATAALGAPGPAVLVAFTLGNFAEALSSAAGMDVAGRSKRYIFGLWLSVSAAVVAVAGASAALFAAAPPGAEAACNTFAAGALISMTVEAMIPEATHDTASFNGVIAAAGFLAIVLLLSVGA